MCYVSSLSNNMPHQRNTQPEIEPCVMPAFIHNLFQKPVVTEVSLIVKQ